MGPVVVALQGGLGNQLFQYAAGRALAQRLGAPLAVDTSQFDGCGKRDFALHQFAIRVPRMRRSEVVLRFHALHCDRGVGGLLRRLGVIGCLYKEAHFHFDPHLAAQWAPVLLSGYWQSPAYFEAIAPQLRVELQPADSLPELAQPLLSQLQAADSIAVHVRRGDYVSDTQANAVHGVCTLDYYRAALSALAERGASGPVVVFSDDASWVKKKFLHHFQGQAVTPSLGLTDAQEMWLMSRAHHQVIANSSFSWWAGWMNDRPGRLVLAPRQWFYDPARDSRDLFPDDWVLL